MSDGPSDLRMERAQSAGRSRDKSIIPNAVGSAESLASAGPRYSHTATQWDYLKARYAPSLPQNQIKER